MTLKNLHGLYDFDDIVPYIDITQGSISSYRHVYDRLLILNPDPSPDNEFADADIPRNLVLRVLPSIDQVYGYTVLHGDERETWYNLYYDTWSYWLSRKIYARDLVEYGPQQFLAKCLNSMTVISFNEDEIALERAKILSDNAYPQI